MSEQNIFAPTGHTALALRPEAYGASYGRGAQQGEGYEMRGDLAVVTVRGPLMHHSSWFWDSYEAILGRVQRALGASPRTLLLAINSPGGLVEGCFETAQAIRAAADAARVHVVAYCDGTMTSAAYALACAADTIYAPEAGTVGSIGVIGGLVDRTEFTRSLGYRIELITSGARKGDGHPDKAITDDAIAAAQAEITNLAEIFFAHVSARRGVSIDAIRGLEAGVMQGAEAKSRGLIDDVKTMREVLESLGRQGTTTMNLQMIAVALGLAPDATEEQVIAAARAASSVATALRGLTGQSELGPAVATLEAWRASHARVGEMSGELERIRREAADNAAATAIREAIDGGRLQPAQRETAEQLYAGHGAPALTAFLAALTPIVQMGPGPRPPARPANGHEGASDVALTDEDKAVARQLGLSDEEMAKAKAADRKDA